jgi:hypothetical protein
MSTNIPEDDGSVDALPFTLSTGLDDMADSLFMPEDDRADLAAPAEVVMANNALIRVWLPVWLENMGRTLSVFQRDMEREDRSARMAQPDHLPEDRESAVVVGSGASLVEALPFLKQYKGTIICGPTNLGALWAHGISPHFCILVDVGPFSTGYFTKLKIDDRDLAERGLHRPAVLLPTTCQKEAAIAAPGKRYWFKHAIQGANGLLHPYNILTGLLVPHLSDMILQSGCVVNSAVCVPTLLNLRADGPFSRIRRIFLVGADLAYTAAGRVACYRWFDGEFRPEPVPSPDQNSSAVKVQTKDGKRTDEAMLSYKRSLLTIWEMLFPAPGRKTAGAVRMWTCTPADRTILTEIPYAPLRMVIADGGKSLREYTYDELAVQYHHYFTETGIADGQTFNPTAKTDNAAILAPLAFSTLRKNVCEAIGLLKSEHNTDSEENRSLLEAFTQKIDEACRLLPEYADPKEVQP